MQSQHILNFWAFHLKDVKNYEKIIEQYLTEDEVARANHYLIEAKKEQFILARGLLRKILSQFLHCLPTKVCLDNGPFGKLCVKNPHSFYFNLSHSKDVITYILSETIPVGVDVEYRRDIDIVNLKNYVFTPSEWAYAASLPIVKRQSYFFKIWTAKEALLKGLGIGHQFPFQQIETHLNDLYFNSKCECLNLTEAKRLNFHNWSIHLMDLFDHYQIAIASENQGLSYMLNLNPKSLEQLVKG